MPTDARLTRLTAALTGERGDDQRRIAETALSWADTLLAKNADYGGSAWREPVLCPKLPVGTAILVRMSDKVERIRGLLARGDPPDVANESITDTLTDLGAYCLLYLARPAKDA